MKKGLRHPAVPLARGDPRNTDRPDEEGIKTGFAALCGNFDRETQTDLMKKGLRHALDASEQLGGVKHRQT